MSDIITNSSSEVFCRISSQNELEQIYSFLKGIFPGDEYEIDVVVELENSNNIAIELPYHLEDFGRFIEVGLPVVLKEKFPSEDFTVIFD